MLRNILKRNNKLCQAQLFFNLLYARLRVSTFLNGHHQTFLHYESKDAFDS